MEQLQLQQLQQQLQPLPRLQPSGVLLLALCCCCCAWQPWLLLL